MEKSLVILILFFTAFTAAAQTLDSCEQIRLRWADTTADLRIITGGIDREFLTPVPLTNHIGDGTGMVDIAHGMPGSTYGWVTTADIKYRTRYFPETKPTPKINLWGNSQPLKFGSYRITNTKLAGWVVLSFAGAIDGVVEGYEFDGRTSFERKYGANPNGYFGSRSWEKAHTKETLYTKYFGAWDFYHHADDARKIGYITGGVIVGLSGANEKWWHYSVDLGLSFIISGTCKAAGMYWVRN